MSSTTQNAFGKITKKKKDQANANTQTNYNADCDMNCFYITNKQHNLETSSQ